MHLEAEPEEVDIVDGRAFVKADPARGKTVRDMLWFGDMVPVVVTVTQMPDVTKTGAPFFATFAEVEVDTETGKVDVLKMVVVHDCGTVMYASGAEAQQVGSQTFGVGESLTEEIDLRRGHGRSAQLQLGGLPAAHHPGLPRRGAGAARGLEGRG